MQMKRINGKILSGLMCAAMIISLTPIQAKAATNQKKPVSYVENVAEGKWLVDGNGLVLFSGDTYSGKWAKSANENLTSHTEHCATKGHPVDHWEKIGFNFVGVENNVTVTNKDFELVVGSANGETEFYYDTVTASTKLKVKSGIVKLSYLESGDFFQNYTKCVNGQPWACYSYTMGTKIQVDTIKNTNYKIKYDLKGGKVSDKKNLPTKVDICPEEQIIYAEMPTKKGYRFVRWEFTNAKGENIDETFFGYDAEHFWVNGLMVDDYYSNWDTVKELASGTITATVVWEKVTANELNKVVFDSAADNAQYQITSDKATKKNVKYCNLNDATAKSATIPESVCYVGRRYTVTEIGEGAFEKATKVKNITIYSTAITKVEKNALKGLKSSTVIKVPKSKLKDYKAMFKKAGFKGTVKAI